MPVTCLVRLTVLHSPLNAQHSVVHHQITSQFQTLYSLPLKQLLLHLSPKVLSLHGVQWKTWRYQPFTTSNLDGGSETAMKPLLEFTLKLILKWTMSALTMMDVKLLENAAPCGQTTTIRNVSVNLSQDKNKPLLHSISSHQLALQLLVVHQFLV